MRYELLPQLKAQRVNFGKMTTLQRGALNNRTATEDMRWVTNYISLENMGYIYFYMTLININYVSKDVPQK